MKGEPDRTGAELVKKLKRELINCNVINRNVFISSFSAPLFSSYHTRENEIIQFGNIDSNYFCYPVSAVQ
ncbi:MAG: hypothetical protein B6D37_06195 [Sphingobacteriales bacterium UTBCD1]|nr:MAG: hypothetical protein B6D37_06195 [Sphingobacteriales bacterium UTBCD1]